MSTVILPKGLEDPDVLEEGSFENSGFIISTDECRSTDTKRACINRSGSTRVAPTSPLALHTHPKSPGDAAQQTNSQRGESALSGRTNEQLEESGIECCTVFNRYKDFVMLIRNSVFMHILKIVLFLISTFAIVIGLFFREKCPASPGLPIISTIVGAGGALMIGLFMIKSYKTHHRIECTFCQNVCFGVYCSVFFVFALVEAVFIFKLSPSFSPSSTEYCNETFYMYAFYKKIATATVGILMTVLYLPDICSYNVCYQNEPSLLPAELRSYHTIY